MYPVATDCADGDPLPGVDEVARYCPPSGYDRDLDEPLVGAFIRGPTQNDLSCYRLQFYQGRDRTGAVHCIRTALKELPYGLKPTGRFVVFNVEQAKVAARDIGFDIDVIYTPKPWLPSHSSVVNLPADANDEFRVATALWRLINRSDVYPGVL